MEAVLGGPGGEREEAGFVEADELPQTRDGPRDLPVGGRRRLHLHLHELVEDLHGQRQRLTNHAPCFSAPILLN